MMRKFEAAKTKMRKREIIFNNFLGGIAWGLGATIGVSVLFAVLGIIGQQLGFIPIIGSFFSDIIDIILQNARR